MTYRAIVFFLFTLTWLLGSPDANDRFYEAIRTNDQSLVRTLLKEYGANIKDARGQTPLMLASAFGTLDAMRLLISSGADVDVENDAGATALLWASEDVEKVRLLLEHCRDQRACVNKATPQGRTPLMVAAATTDAFESVKLLLDKGADVNAQDRQGHTALTTAAKVNNERAVKLLLERGANIDAKANSGDDTTVLMGAALNGNAELVKFLLDRKADVRAVSGEFSGTVKKGKVAFGNASVLHFGVISGSVQTVKLLLDAGAPVNARDVRGMTPLVFAVSTDRPNSEIIQLLLSKGADPSIQTNDHETAIDWARKFNNPAVLHELKLQPVPVGGRDVVVQTEGKTERQAVELSLPVLQRASSTVFSEGGCVACHAQPLAGMALKYVRDRRWHMDDSVSASGEEESRRVANALTNAMQQMLQGVDGGGNPDTFLYQSLMISVTGLPANRGTDALVHFLAAKQHPDGHWSGAPATRAPIQDGNFSRTAMAIRTLAFYGTPAQKTQLQERIRRAADWLGRQMPLSTEDRVMQILGLKWSMMGQEQRLKELVDALIRTERDDGGWAQTPSLGSDAYATGQVLYTLSEIGIHNDAAFRRGVEFLLRTQKNDGSWYVASRAMKVQPYFLSGFPYEHDQWISTAATAWAAIALSRSPSLDGQLKASSN